MTRDPQTISAELKELERKRNLLEAERTELYWAQRRLDRKAKKSTLTTSPWTNDIGQVINVGDKCVGVTANRGAKATVGTFAGFNQRGGKTTSVRLNIMKEVLYYKFDGRLFKRYPRVTDRQQWQAVERVKSMEVRGQSFVNCKVFKLG